MVLAVGMRSGKLRYIDVHGNVFEGDDLVNPRGQVDFVDAVIASAAMPVTMRGDNGCASLEAMVEMAHVVGDGRHLVTYTFDPDELRWRSNGTVTAEGKAVAGALQ